MAGKARVHELAKELGLSSRQVLSKLQDLGAYVKSPSSTVEAPIARQLRESVITGRGQAGPSRRAWPHGSAANNPATPPPAPPQAGPPPPRTAGQRPGPRPRPFVEPPPDDDSFIADLRRAQARSHRPTSASRQPKPKENPIVEIILKRMPSLRFPGEPVPYAVHDWARMWTNELFEPADVATWMDAGLKGNEAKRATDLCRKGWTPQTWPGRRPGTTA